MQWLNALEANRPEFGPGILIYQLVTLGKLFKLHIGKMEMILNQLLRFARRMK